MDEVYKNLAGRLKLIDELAEKILADQCSSIYVIYGASGSGKKYVLDEVASHKKIHDKIPIFTIIDGKIVNYLEQKIHKKYSIDFSFALPFGFGCRLSKSANNSKLQMLVHELKKINSKKIIFILGDIDKQENPSQETVGFLLKNKKYIETQSKKDICVLITSENMLFTDSSIINIQLLPYEVEDIKEYLTFKNHIKYDKSNSLRLSDKLTHIHEISGGDLNLVSLIYSEIESLDDYSLHKFVDYILFRLDKIKKRASNKNITDSVIEDIVITSSICFEHFNKQMLTQATKNDEKVVEIAIELGTNEQFFTQNDSDRTSNYFFASDKVKKCFFEMAEKKLMFRVPDLYNYLSTNKLESYLHRAYYLHLHYKEINQEILALIILGLANSFIFANKWEQDKIDNFFSTKDKNIEYATIYNLFFTAYSKESMAEYDTSIEALQKIDTGRLNIILRTEYYRLLFRNYYMLGKRGNEIEKAKNYLITSVKSSNTLSLSLDEQFVIHEEILFKYSILIELCPYVLDKDNNYMLFNDLMEILQDVTLNISKDKNSKYLNYLLNIFRRKAFLYANPQEANFYYEEAKNYFSDNEIWDEYVITLICEAGTSIVCGDYKNSIFCVKQSLKLISERGVVIPNKEKAYNNLFIAEFMKFESNDANSLQDIKICAQETIQKLKTLLSKKNSTTEHVLLTNIASLCLYIGNTDDYLLTKKTIEGYFKCDNIADAKDESIDDFYRYYFALDEIYLNILKKNWVEAKTILDTIDGFVPVLFKKQEVYWGYKIEAIKGVISRKNIVNGYDYCNNLVMVKNRETTLSKFFFRGLMLSDLQYASYN